MKQTAAFLVLVAIIIGAYMLLSRPSNQTPVSQSSVGVSDSVATTAESSQKMYSLADISSHNSANSCWMAINGTVYDVTSYIDKHPDGPSILKGCGKDATDMYTEVRKHRREGDAMLPTYAIGVFK